MVSGLVVWATKEHRNSCSSNSSLSSVIFHSLFLVNGLTDVLRQGQITTISIQLKNFNHPTRGKFVVVMVGS